MVGGDGEGCLISGDTVDGSEIRRSPTGMYEISTTSTGYPDFVHQQYERIVHGKNERSYNFLEIIDVDEYWMIYFQGTVGNIGIFYKYKFNSFVCFAMACTLKRLIWSVLLYFSRPQWWDHVSCKQSRNMKPQQDTKIETQKEITVIWLFWTSYCWDICSTRVDTRVTSKLVVNCLLFFRFGNTKQWQEFMEDPVHMKWTSHCGSSGWIPFYIIISKHFLPLMRLCLCTTSYQSMD